MPYPRTSAFTGSFIGALVGVVMITFLAPLVAKFALRFGPPEFFAVLKDKLGLRSDQAVIADLLEHVRSMGAAAERVSLVASGKSQSLEGPICITASEVISAKIVEVNGCSRGTSP